MKQQNIIPGGGAGVSEVAGPSVGVGDGAGPPHVCSLVDGFTMKENFKIV